MESLRSFTPTVSSSSSPVSDHRRCHHIGEKVVLCAYFIFQVIIEFFNLGFKRLYWDCKHVRHLQQLPAFIMSRPPRFNQSHNDLFSTLLNAYCQIEGISGDPAKTINHQLKRGCCHGEVLRLVQLVKNNEGSLVDHIPVLNSQDAQVTLLEMLEIFRYTFEMHNRDDLVATMQPLLPPNMSSQKSYHGSSHTVAQCIRRDLQNFKGLIVTRLHNDRAGHTLLLSLDPVDNRYGFYNPTSLGGYYEYDSLDAFVSALTEHVLFHTHYSQWQLSWYPEESHSLTS